MDVNLKPMNLCVKPEKPKAFKNQIQWVLKTKNQNQWAMFGYAPKLT